MEPTSSCLIYVCGPSGAGKDALLRLARERLAARGFVFPQRVITRPADGSEKHIEMSHEEFSAAAARGAFCMQWQSHGLSYGIPAALRAELAAGNPAVVNGSREYLPEARRLFPQMLCLMITAPAAVIATRLAQRGREDDEAIAERMERNRRLAEFEADVVHENHGDLQASGEAFVALLARLAAMHGQRAEPAQS
jgi:ribose 1,5-bisphosphokinase